MAPTVSVIIATHNYGRFLKQALTSVLDQTFSDFEVLIIDDGSTDNTSTVVQAFQADPRIHYHRTPRQGQPRAKNTGIQLAQGPYLAFLDADDTWMPTKLDRQLALFQRDPRLGVVYSRRRLFDEQGYEVEYTQPALVRDDVLGSLFWDNVACFSSCLVRRSIFQDVGLFDDNLPLAIDYDLWLRVARHYRFDYVDEPLVWYRVGHASLSRRSEERSRVVLGIMERFLTSGGAVLLPAAAIARKYARVYSALGLAVRSHSYWQGLGWFALALTTAPSYWPAWRGLVTALIPHRPRQWLRRWLGCESGWRRLEQRSAVAHQGKLHLLPGLQR